METVRTTLPRLTRLIVLLALVTAFVSEASTEQSAPISAVVDAFHNALRHGDGKAAIELFAADALILESGSVETRAEYEAHHLQEDIRFARTVRNTRSDVRVAVEGNTAWLTSQSRAEGSFEGKQVSTSGVELAVLTKTSNGWRDGNDRSRSLDSHMLRCWRFAQRQTDASFVSDNTW